MFDLISKIPAEVAYVAIAAVGGISRYLFQYLNSEGNFAWGHFIAHTFISCFSGYMFFLFGANVLNMQDGGVSILAGMGGWMGVEALKLIEASIKSKINHKES